MVIQTPCIPSACWPPCPAWPFPGEDMELVRLRRMRQQREREEEKEELRRWLRRHGVDEHRIAPPWPWTPTLLRPAPASPSPSLEDVLRRIR